MNQPAMNLQTRRGMLAITASLVFESGISLTRATEEFKREAIKFQLAQYRGNQCKTARMLGIHRNTLARMMKELGITSNKEHWRTMYRLQKERAEKFVAQSATGSSSVQAALQA